MAKNNPPKKEKRLPPARTMREMQGTKLGSLSAMPIASEKPVLQLDLKKAGTPVNLPKGIQELKLEEKTQRATLKPKMEVLCSRKMFLSRSNIEFLESHLFSKIYPTFKRNVKACGSHAAARKGILRTAFPRKHKEEYYYTLFARLTAIKKLELYHDKFTDLSLYNGGHPPYPPELIRGYKNWLKLVEKNPEMPGIYILPENLYDQEKTTNSPDIEPSGIEEEFESASETTTVTPPSPTGPEVIAGLEVTPVHSVTTGEFDDDLLAINSLREPHEPQDDLLDQHRFTDAIKHLALTGADRGMRIIKLYRNNATSDKTPYNLIDIETHSGEFLQILVLDHHNTWVIRKAEGAFVPNQPINIRELKDNSQAYFFSYRADYIENWKTSLTKFAFDPIETLPKQAKHRVSWPDKTQAIIYSYIAEIVHTGEMPKTNSKIQISFGELGKAKDTTWSKANSALTKSHDPYLKEHGITSLSTLAAHVFAMNPVLKHFKFVKPIHAVDVFTKVAQQIIDDPNFDFARGVTDPDNEEHAVLDMAFEYGAVRGMDKIIGANEQPGTRNAFFVAAGLATRNPDRTITPVSAHTAAELLDIVSLEEYS